MSPADQIQVVPIEELRDDVRAEGEGHPAVVLPPPLDVLVGVGPEEITEQARVGHVGRPHDAADLLHRLQVGGEAAVAAEDLLVDDGRDRQAVEAVRERLPQLHVESAFA